MSTKMVWHTSFWGSEQGHPNPVEWPTDRVGTVIQERASKYLLEFKDGARAWASKRECEEESTYRERENARKPQAPIDRANDCSSTG